MIVCHGNRIDHLDVEARYTGLLTNELWKPLAAVSVCKVLGKRPHCGTSNMKLAVFPASIGRSSHTATLVRI